MTNVVMSGRTGTEIATAELALAFRARGHRVAVYTPGLGPAALELMAQGVPVTDRVERIGFTPDIIHGSHNVALAVAMVCFPVTPAIFVCHDTSQSFDAPIACDRIGAYVAVDSACVERLVVAGIHERLIDTIPNGIDLARFEMRDRWPERPRTALAITKHRAPYLDQVREACQQDGLVLEVVGPGVGRVTDDLPSLCGQADVVFAASRSAMEAAATGAAVILCDERGFGGLLRPREVEQWPHTRLSRRQLKGPVTVASLRTAIAEYDRPEVIRFTQLLRDRLSLTRIATEYEDLYRRVRLSWLHRTADAEDVARPLAAFVATLLPRFGRPAELQERHEQVEQRKQEFDDWFALYGCGATGLCSISFGQDRLSRLLLEEGWHPGEEWGVWSRDDVAVIRLPCRLVEQWGCDLAIGCFHYIPWTSSPGESRCVQVLSEGRILAHWDFTRLDKTGVGGQRRLSIPRTLLQPGGSLRIAFRMAHAQSPLEAGESPDPRRLGFALISVGGFSTLLV